VCGKTAAAASIFWSAQRTPAAAAKAFGSYLDVQSALRIGLFPKIPLAKFRQVGNAAGIGARQMLISGSQRRLGESLAKQIEYVELATHPHFQDKFAQSLFF
jgi:uncharacterized 2Fe-2S/4Fe-4S cluster protein (DUF4445 family)